MDSRMVARRSLISCVIHVADFAVCWPSIYFILFLYCLNFHFIWGCHILGEIMHFSIPLYPGASPVTHFSCMKSADAISDSKKLTFLSPVSHSFSLWGWRWSSLLHQAKINNDDGSLTEGWRLAESKEEELERWWSLDGSPSPGGYVSEKIKPFKISKHCLRFLQCAAECRPFWWKSLKLRKFHWPRSWTQAGSKTRPRST